MADTTNRAIDNRRVLGHTKYAESVLPNSQGLPRSGAPLVGVQCSLYPARVTQIDQAVERFQRTGLRFYQSWGGASLTPGYWVKRLRRKHITQRNFEPWPAND
jgi:hypothetical protein